MLEEMIAARVYSDRMMALQRQGRFPIAVPIDGMEAAVVGAIGALKPKHDWVFPQYREPMGMARYGPEVLRSFFAYMRGHPAGAHLPASAKVFPPQISLATQIPHALGLAWSQQLRGERGATAVFFGDGSSSEGDFYEAGNFAGVLRAPLIMICMNNQWAISTPIEAQTAASSFADKAHAFGFPGVVVDGNDVVQVFEAVAAARQRAVEGLGPTLVEVVTYRLGAHTSSDDPTRYVDPGELEAARALEPIGRLSAEVTDRELWDPKRRDQIEATASTRVDEICDWLFALDVDPAMMFDHVAVDPGDRVRAQRAERSAGRP